MNQKEVIKYSLSLPNTYEDYPFPKDNNSITMKHKENKKWFALVMNVKDKIYLNVKTDPSYSELLRSSYDYIIPAYHMNKEHWNTIIISNKVDDSLVKELIEQSYELTKK
ncbi:MAG: MmcQ/YjbR family DNA-binding protein [Clostridia bacterium]|nr:MmcQ/YjbR family DNA-binding protein [Clostridia bacterium]